MRKLSLLLLPAVAACVDDHLDEQRPMITIGALSAETDVLHYAYGDGKRSLLTGGQELVDSGTVSFEIEALEGRLELYAAGYDTDAPFVGGAPPMWTSHARHHCARELRDASLAIKKARRPKPVLLDSEPSSGCGLQMSDYRMSGDYTFDADDAAAGGVDNIRVLWIDGGPESTSLTVRAVVGDYVAEGLAPAPLRFFNVTPSGAWPDPSTWSIALSNVLTNSDGDAAVYVVALPGAKVQWAFVSVEHPGEGVIGVFPVRLSNVVSQEILIDD